jgi:hypothetical protein
VTDCAPIAATVRAIVLRQWPGRFAPGQLDDDTSLGAEGLGLDSMAAAAAAWLERYLLAFPGELTPVFLELLERRDNGSVYEPLADEAGGQGRP